MCCGCDQNLHDVSSQHQRRAVSSYMGCPSAKDFAALWGFELNEQDNNNGVIQNQQGISFILQQIVDLKRLQLTQGLKKFDGNVDRGLQNLTGTGIHERDNRLQDLEVDSFPFPYTNLEHPPSSSTAGIPSQGESFWQIKSPIQSNQFWSQTMQDLRVCEDMSSHDDLKIPDVDLTFRNFEELFGCGGDQDPLRALLDDKDVSCSSVENDMSLDQSDYGYPRAVEDASAASFYGTQSVQMERDKNNSSHMLDFQQNFDFSQPIRASYSTMSFPLSRFGNESNSVDFPDSELSPTAGGETSSYSHELDGMHTEARGNAMMRYKEKKKARQHDRQVRYATQKANAEVRKKIKGECPKTEGYDSDAANVTRSI